MDTELALARRRELRRRSTDAERLLWRLLRGRQLLGAKFRRQDLVGSYILDFYCVEQRLAVELDGGQHFTAEGQAHDERRSRYLVTRGLRVLRFSNRELFEEIEGVVEKIKEALGR